MHANHASQSWLMITGITQFAFSLLFPDCQNALEFLTDFKKSPK